MTKQNQHHSIQSDSTARNSALGRRIRRAADDERVLFEVRITSGLLTRIARVAIAALTATDLAVWLLLHLTQGRC